MVSSARSLAAGFPSYETGQVPELHQHGTTRILHCCIGLGLGHLDQLGAIQDAAPARHLLTICQASRSLTCQSRQAAPVMTLLKFGRLGIHLRCHRRWVSRFRRVSPQTSNGATVLCCKSANYRAPPWDMPCAMNPDGGKGKETLVAADSSTDQRCPDSLPCVSCVEMAMDGEKTSWSGLVLWSPRTTNWCREGGGKLATGWKLAEAARHPALSLAETHTMVGWLRPWTCAYATGQAARLAVRSLKRPDCTARRQAVRVLPNNTAGASGAECRLGRPRALQPCHCQRHVLLCDAVVADSTWAPACHELHGTCHKADETGRGI